MYVGIPGQDDRPAPPRSGARRAAKWLLAAVGAGLAYLAAQVATLVAATVALPALGFEELSLVATAACLALAALWWRRLAPRALVRRAAARPSRPGARVLLAFCLVALGLLLQVALSASLSLVLPLFPDVMSDYLELMELAGVGGETSLLALADVAVLAPVAEEALCRGVIFEFCLRAFCPGSEADRQGREGVVAPGRFWAANVAQALIFATMHLNVVQGCYAFVLGVLLGWIARRTGRLRSAALLHMAVNGASALSGILDALLGGALVPALAVCSLAAAALIALVARLTAAGPLAEGDPSGGGAPTCATMGQR